MDLFKDLFCYYFVGLFPEIHFSLSQFYYWYLIQRLLFFLFFSFKHFGFLTFLLTFCTHMSYYTNLRHQPTNFLQRTVKLLNCPLGVEKIINPLICCFWEEELKMLLNQVLRLTNLDLKPSLTSRSLECGVCV